MLRLSAKDRYASMRLSPYRQSARVPPLRTDHGERLILAGWALLITRLFVATFASATIGAEDRAPGRHAARWAVVGNGSPVCSDVAARAYRSVGHRRSECVHSRYGAFDPSGFTANCCDAWFDS